MIVTPTSGDACATPVGVLRGAWPGGAPALGVSLDVEVDRAESLRLSAVLRGEGVPAVLETVEADGVGTFRFPDGSLAVLELLVDVPVPALPVTVGYPATVGRSGRRGSEGLRNVNPNVAKRKRRRCETQMGTLRNESAQPAFR